MVRPGICSGSGKLINGVERFDVQGAVVMLLRGEYRELLADRDCRSGYEYARKYHRVWRREPPDVLQTMATVYLELYRQEDNRNSLGIALYLYELVNSMAGPG